MNTRTPFDSEVRHEPAARRFSVRLGAYEASLMYAEEGQVWDFYHIYVPDPFRNQGIAEHILSTAFQEARRTGRRVVPSCPFIAGSYVPRHPEFREVVRPGVFLFHGEEKQK